MNHAEWPDGGREASILRPHRGCWVAQRGLKVLVSTESPQQVMSWLTQHDAEGAIVFRVPAQPDETQGASTLGL